MLGFLNENPIQCPPDCSGIGNYTHRIADHLDHRHIQGARLKLVVLQASIYHTRIIWQASLSSTLFLPGAILSAVCSTLVDTAAAIYGSIRPAQVSGYGADASPLEDSQQYEQILGDILTAGNGGNHL